MCYHPLFVFNQFGDCEGAMLRAGNVHSAHRWRDVLEPILARYGRTGVRRYVKGGVIMDRRCGGERSGVALQNWTTRRLL